MSIKHTWRESNENISKISSTASVGHYAVWASRSGPRFRRRGFTDVPSTHVRHTEISQAVEQGLFTGTSDTTFDPEGPMTRAMLAVVISRLAGVSVDNSSQSSFTDVPTGAWYSGAAAWAAKAGIVGDASAAFEPDAVITGEELTTLLTKYADYAWHPRFRRMKFRAFPIRRPL